MKITPEAIAIIDGSKSDAAISPIKTPSNVTNPIPIRLESITKYGLFVFPIRVSAIRFVLSPISEKKMIIAVVYIGIRFNII